MDYLENSEKTGFVRGDIMKNLTDIIIEFIENNKAKYNISYKNSIESIKELIEEIEQEYEELEG